MSSVKSHHSEDAHFFEYEPLPARSFIRLLRRTGKTQDGKLCFNMEVCDLEADEVEYHCLSYTWGNPYADGVYTREHYDSVNEQYQVSNQVPIYVDGKIIHIQKNLYDALNTVANAVFVEELNRILENGQTYLHRVAGQGLAQVIERRIKRGARVDIIDDFGKLPLHYAAENGHIAAVEVLCHAGSPLATTDLNGKTPIDLARDGGFSSVIQLLEMASTAPEFRKSSIVKVNDGADDLIWADAICINQNDVDEKSIQVSMMDWIYSKAIFVLAWLGPEDKSTKAGVRTLKTLTSHMKRFKESEIVPYGGHDKQSYEAADIPYIPWEDWVALASIFQRQWFKRSWIIQEAVLPVLLIMYCGKQKIPWYDLGIVAEGLRNQEARLGTSRSKIFVPGDQVAVPVEWNMAEIIKWRIHMAVAKGPDVELASKHQSYFRFEELVDCFWTFRATDLRDKVFSLSGILNVFADERLEADYRQSVETVYTAAARRLMLETGSLSFLSNCIYSKQRHSSLPTWVPDFNLPGVNGIPNLFSADKGLEFEAPREPSGDDKILRIRGHRLGKISQAAHRPGLRPGEKFIFDPLWLSMVLSLSQNQEVGSNTTLSELLWRTTCMDMSYGSFFDAAKYGLRAPDEFGHQFKILMMVMILAAADAKVLDHMGIEKGPNNQECVIAEKDYNPFDDMGSLLADLDAIESHDGESNCLPTRLEVLTLWDSLRYTLARLTRANADGSPVDVYLPPRVMEEKARIVGNGTVETESRLFSNCRSFATAYEVAYGGRKLFSLDRRYLGLAPLSAQEGDEVWILPGLSSPAVLRRVETSVENALSELSIEETTTNYEFVGAAFVHGIMHGEALQGAAVTLEDIALI